MLWRYVCSGMYGDLKPSGVMMCVAPASEWWPRSWALHDFICIMYIRSGTNFDILVSIPFCILHVFSYGLYFCTLCFTYSVHLSYWPPFFGGCVSCPQVQTPVIHHCRLHVLLLQSAPFDSEPVCRYIYFLGGICFCIFDYLGYGGALSRHMFSFVFVEACSHICGSRVLYVSVLITICVLMRSVCYGGQNGPYVYICTYDRRCAFRRFYLFRYDILVCSTA